MGLRANPTYRQRRFGAEVRKIRERAGLNVGESATVMSMQMAHISSVETGRTGLSEERLRALAAASGREDTAYVDALVEMGRASGRGWWSSYRERVRPSLLDLAELEAGARGIIGYEPMFIPGLLQTEEYAAIIHHEGYARETPEALGRAVEFRMERQRIVTGEDAPLIHLVIHEAALHVSLGSREVMRDQLLRLIEMSRLPNVTIQVLPFDGPVAFGTSFTLVEPDVAALGTVVVAHVEQSLYLGGSEELARYKETFARLREMALPAVDAAVRPEAHVNKDSPGLIQRLLYPLL
ncbi:helix-turn-helix domain-containing protein [Streptomyces buecherae]|uniref:Helix-turn-helix transcriptional regulator n=1 Tax=Streptomyces buecherae TaxID=2763006 RepID=A0A7H8NJK9_9ACTN|nr:helix-turn-helix transcriptional regulator [Streptomyces buecherae]QKW54739.1 helix-turn-helix transcriptional regulator [Streptomyces buecherae]